MAKDLVRLAFALLTALSMAACETSDNKDANKQNPGELVNKTDYSVCHTNPVPRGIEGSWFMEQSQGPFSFVTTFEISNGNLHLVNDCTMNGVNLTAEVSVPVTYTDSTFKPLQPGHDVQNYGSSGFKMSCEASVSIEQLNYSFDGNCLVFSSRTNAKRMVLAPR